MRAVGLAVGRAAVEVVDMAIAEAVGTVIAETADRVIAEVGTEAAGRMAVELAEGHTDRPLAVEASFPGRENALRSSVEAADGTVAVAHYRMLELRKGSSAEGIRNPTFLRMCE